MSQPIESKKMRCNGVAFIAAISLFAYACGKSATYGDKNTTAIIDNEKSQESPIRTPAPSVTSDIPDPIAAVTPSSSPPAVVAARPDSLPPIVEVPPPVEQPTPPSHLDDKGCAEPTGFVRPIFFVPASTSEPVIPWAYRLDLARDSADIKKGMEAVQKQFGDLLAPHTKPGCFASFKFTDPEVYYSRNSHDHFMNNASLTPDSFHWYMREFLASKGLNRNTAKDVYVFIYMRPDNTGYLNAGGRTLNGAAGTGGGGARFDVYDTRINMFLSTLAHEIGHGLGLLHVWQYPAPSTKNRDTDTSMMSYNLAHRSIDRFTLSQTPGGLHDMELYRLNLNKDVFPNLNYTPTNTDFDRTFAFPPMNSLEFSFTNSDTACYAVCERPFASWEPVSTPHACSSATAQRVCRWWQEAPYKLNTKIGYELYLDDSIASGPIPAAYSLVQAQENCAYNISNNPNKRVRCVWRTATETWEKISSNLPAFAQTGYQIFKRGDQIAGAEAATWSLQQAKNHCATLMTPVQLASDRIRCVWQSPSERWVRITENGL